MPNASGGLTYDRLREAGIVLPDPPPPTANFDIHVQEGSLIFLSGQGPQDQAGEYCTGKVGAEVPIENAHAHARLIGIGLLAVLHAALGDLGGVKRILKLLGMVDAAPDSAAHPQVIDGCSELFVQLFGEAGRHARSAVGLQLAAPKYHGRERGGGGGDRVNPDASESRASRASVGA